MIHIEIPFNFSDKYFQLKSIYDNISSQVITNQGIIHVDNYLFNNYLGDITKGIKWTWAINKKSFSLFEEAIEEIRPIINDYFHNDFILRGCSFITLFEKEVSNSDFHFDITSHYDKKETTNTLTLIFPLYIEEDMGNLEYKDILKETKVYKYKQDNIFVWDACKLEHRTQPYSLTEKKKRVLVSMNFSTKEEWSVVSVNNSLKCQGNKIINHRILS